MCSGSNACCPAPFLVCGSHCVGAVCSLVSGRAAGVGARSRPGPSLSRHCCSGVPPPPPPSPTPHHAHTHTPQTASHPDIAPASLRLLPLHICIAPRTKLCTTGYINALARSAGAVLLSAHDITIEDKSMWSQAYVEVLLS